jgi:SAM-dependent methyltransferase
MNNPNKIIDAWTKRWDKRYRDAAFAYGEAPNDFLKSELIKLPLGSILFPAEGEGRNAVFAAQQGWQVSAFDISNEGRKKAMQLAKKNNVNLVYQVGELDKLGFKKDSFDALALIYAHFPAAIKSQLHKALDSYLKIDGTLIFEAFSKNHLAYQKVNEKVGGPKDIESLFSIEEIKADFPNYEIITLEEKEIELQEGLYHNGLGSVIRFVGRKKNNQ